MVTFRARPTKLARSLRNDPTEAEKLLWRHLRANQLGHKFSRQMPIGPFIADFLCRELRLVIEINGGQHRDNARDESRTRLIEAEGFRVFRFWNNEVMENLDGVLVRIAETLTLPPPSTPSRMREGKSGEAATGWGIE